ncbi:hypothetical protein, partial [Phaeovulum sp. NW3]|uniref:hypothetical protein n=1 Tax=Phaeovulum sp. NW3 TaxID=2934933 RepID=UPI0020222328
AVIVPRVNHVLKPLSSRDYFSGLLVFRVRHLPPISPDLVDRIECAALASEVARPDDWSRPF